MITDIQADELLEEVRELKHEKSRFETIAAGKIGIIEEDLKHKSDKIDKQIQFMKDQLQGFFTTVDKRDSKTQQSYNLFSGKLVMKKATQKIAHDDVELLAYAIRNKMDYVKQSTVYKLDYTEFKKDLVISNGMIVNKSTNEILEGVNGLSIEEVSEQFDIK